MSIGGEPKLSDVHKNYKAKHCRIYKKSYLDVEDIISESPTQTPCLFSGISDLRPSSKIGIISGSTLSPSFFTRSPRVRAATYKRSFSNINLQSYLHLQVQNYFWLVKNVFASYQIFFGHESKSHFMSGSNLLGPDQNI